jgi:hypothetical protein
MSEALKFIEYVIATVFRLLWKLLGFLYLKLWKEPKDIRGPVWTTALWVYLLCGLYLVDVLYESHKPVTVPLLCATGAWWVMSWQNGKPKKLGRPLPYRRRREHRFR